MPKKGTIVLVPFPFTDLSGVKVRPAVVVSALKRGVDVTVAFVSSNVGRIEPTDIALRSSDADFVRTGLKTDSVIRVHKLATLERTVLLGELGTLSKRHLAELDTRLRVMFGLS